MNYKHGLSKSRIYGIWCTMINRCYNPHVKFYESYGGRGIRVCKRWHNFQNFFADMGHRPGGLTLERVDNDRGYSKANCVWATRTQQARNQRNKKRVRANGKLQTLSEWSEETGLSVGTIWRRIYVMGWPRKKAVTYTRTKYRRAGIPRGMSLSNIQ